MIIELILLAAGSYVAAGLLTYGYAVYKNFELMGFLTYRIDKQYIGICKYPQWLLGWLYWMAVKFNWN